MMEFYQTNGGREFINVIEKCAKSISTSLDELNQNIKAQTEEMSKLRESVETLIKATDKDISISAKPVEDPTAIGLDPIKDTYDDEEYER
jgi:phosphotransferase system IIB component